MIAYTNAEWVSSLNQMQVRSKRNRRLSFPQKHNETPSTNTTTSFSKTSVEDLPFDECVEK
jgi:hypothetical protein